RPFFFSSRRRHTRSDRDWSSDVCSSDLVSEMFNLLTGYSQTRRWRKLVVAPVELRERVIALIDRERRHAEAGHPARITVKMNARSEERRVGKEWRWRRSDRERERWGSGR